jgi:hypothetical protein
MCRGRQRRLAAFIKGRREARKVLTQQPLQELARVMQKRDEAHP